MNAFNLTELEANLGAYCQEHRDILVSESLVSSRMREEFDVMENVTDEIPLPNLAVGDLIKPATPGGFDASAGKLVWGSRTLKVRPIQVDLRIVPAELERTWLGKLKDPKDPYDQPFEAFIMDYIIQKAQENVYMKAAYSGVYNSAGTTPVDTMDGLLTIIAAEITATKIAPVVTGAVTDANVIDSVEAMRDGLGDAYDLIPTYLDVSPTIFRMYARAYRSAYGSNQDYTGMAQGLIQVDGSNVWLRSCPALGTSQRMILTPKINKKYGVDSETFNMEIQKDHRGLDVMLDFKAGVNFADINGRGLVVNDQA